MNVGFYGHVRQYHALKAEIDAAMQAVLESGEYVLGPTLAGFLLEYAEFSFAATAVVLSLGSLVAATSLVFLKIRANSAVEVH